MFIIQALNKNGDRYMRLHLFLTSGFEQVRTEHHEILNLCRKRGVGEGGHTTAPRKNRLAWISDQQEVRPASEGDPAGHSQAKRKNSRRSGLVPVNVPTEIARCGFADGRSDGGEVGSDVMLEAALANEAQ
jgi:hypothetical protein